MRAPTHQRGNLLDIVLTDLQNFAHVQLLPPIADHAVVSIRMDIGTATSTPIQRALYNWDKASWTSITEELANTNWDFIKNGLST